MFSLSEILQAIFDFRLQYSKLIVSSNITLTPTELKLGMLVERNKSRTHHQLIDFCFAFFWDNVVVNLDFNACEYRRAWYFHTKYSIIFLFCLYDNSSVMPLL